MKRSEFLRQIIPTAFALPLSLKGFGFTAFTKSTFLENVLNPMVETDRVLVLIQLNGGNDGLNMVLPLDQYTNLANVRGNILIPDTTALILGNHPTGLHPAMTGLYNLYNEEKLSIIQSVGYPNFNSSHFRATDIWATASNSTEYWTTGWIGRYLESEYDNYPTGYPNSTMPDPLALQLGNATPLLSQGSVLNMSLSINNPSTIYDVDNTYEPAPNSLAGYELTYLRQIADQTEVYLGRVQAAYSAGANLSSQYPATSNVNKLADQLKIVARLIKGGLQTRVYVVTLGGFDTHSGQVDTTDHTLGDHANLMNKLSSGIAAFQNDLELLGIGDRVLGMTFSEFGRRIKSNASGGTDHGAAAPMFVFGARVQGGIVGANPSIPSTVATADNLPMQYDFRQVYTTILRNWFCLDNVTADNVMQHSFSTLPLIDSQVSCACNIAVTLSSGQTTICAGQMATFTATPTTGTGTFHYQWKVNGINAGTDSPIFETNTLSNADVVTCIVTNN